MVDPSQIDPDGIARRDFTTAFRGFDQVEVRAFLSSTAVQLRQLLEREADLLRRLELAEERAEQADNIDEHRLAELLGEETARIFEAARETAAEIRAKAETKTAQLVREAQDEANRMTSEAGELLRLRTTEAETAAAAIRDEAESARDKMLADAQVEVEAMRVQASADAERIRGEAQAVLDQAVADAEAEVEAARQQGRDMVAEAQVVRERILKDLARRRRTGKAQLEQLRAARERLLEAYALVRRTVEEATTELAVAVPEARLAADAAARRVEIDDDELTVEAIEAELDAGRVAGVPLLDTGEVPAVRAEMPEPAPAVAPEPEPEPLGPEPEPEPLGPEPEPLESAPEPEPESVVAAEPEPEAPEPEPESHVVVDLFPGRDDEVSDSDAVSEPDAAAHDASEHEAADQEDADQDDAEQDAAVDDDALGDESELPVAAGGVEDLFARLRSEVPAEDASVDDPDDGAVTEAIDEVEGEMADLVVPDETPADQSSHEDETAPVERVEDAAEADATDETLLERRDQHLGDLEHDLARVLKRQLADDENLQLDLIRRGPAKGAPLALPPLEEHRQPLVEAVADSLLLAAAAGAEFVGELLGLEADEPEIVEVNVDLDDIAVELVDSLLVPIRERVSGVIEGSEGDDALDGVRAFYRQGKGVVGEVAAQFVHTAFNRGVFDAVPDGALVRWVVDPGGGPCPDGEDDALEGPITKGTPFPTGHLHPPAHPACRCLLVPGVL